MDYTKHHNSGTAEDFPMENINRNTKVSQYFGAMRVPSMTISRGMNVTDMGFQIHCIEIEAYSAVLRAFIAQSDVLSWDKEGLISELRKELRVSDVEHRELLVKIDSDDSVRMIREFRKGTAGQKIVLSNTINMPASVPSSVAHASRKRLKTSHVAVSSSPNRPPHAQHSPSPTPLDICGKTLIGDSQWDGEAAIFSAKGNIRQSVESVGYNRQASTVGKGRGPVIVKLTNGFLPSSSNNIKKKADTIEIRATDKLIKEVERVICGAEVPNPIKVEKAKLILKNHERAILKALEKLDHVSDDDSLDRSQMNGKQRTTHHAIYGQIDRMRGNYTHGFESHHIDRMDIPSMNLRDDEGTPL